MKILINVFLFFLFLSSSSFAQNLNCQWVLYYLSSLTELHFSLTEKELNSYVQKAALEILDDKKTLSAESKEQMKKKIIEAQGNTGLTCHLVSSLYETVTDFTYEQFLENILSSIDPHTTLLSPQHWVKFKEDKKGAFKGLGITSSPLADHTTGPFKVHNLMPCSSAIQRGLQVHDIITHFNQEPCSQIEILDFTKKIQESKDRGISLTIQRGDQELIIDSLIPSELFKPSVTSYFIEEGLAYIKINGFTQHTSTEMIQELNKLKKAYQKNDLKGIILDLRDNRGGLLMEVAHTADAFIDRGPIVNTYGRDYKHMWEIAANTPGEETQAPLLVLINEQSISGAELLAGVLQDYGKALILGNRSYGKGTILNIWNLEDTSGYTGAILYTLSMYHFPSGCTVQKTGVTPDIEIENPRFKETLQKLGDKRNKTIVYESDCPNALESKNLKTDFKAPYSFREKAKQFISQKPFRTQYSAFEQEDIQLTKSIDYLKMLTLTSVRELHFGKVFYYQTPEHRLHLLTDLFNKDSRSMVTFTFKRKGFSWDKKQLIEVPLYQITGFMTGRQLTLSLEDTPVKEYVKREKEGSFILEITVQKKSKDFSALQTYHHRTIVLF